MLSESLESNIKKNLNSNLFFLSSYCIGEYKTKQGKILSQYKNNSIAR
jgi:hypothetical protein